MGAVRGRMGDRCSTHRTPYLPEPNFQISIRRTQVVWSCEASIEVFVGKKNVYETPEIIMQSQLKNDFVILISLVDESTLEIISNNSIHFRT